MTGQIPDTIRFADLTYSITGIRAMRAGNTTSANGTQQNPARHEPWEELFDPAQHGLAPAALITASLRGYICHYAVTDDRLYLDALIAFLKEQPSAFLGARPSDWRAPPDYEGIWHAYTYTGDAGFKVAFDGFHSPLSFTGELLAGRGFMHDLYLHMRFLAACNFEEVHHFTFSQGRLSEHRDRSQEASEFRQHVRHSYRGEGPIDRLFSLSFDP